MNNNCWIKEILLTEFQYLSFSKLITTYIFDIEKNNKDNTYRIKCKEEEEEKWGWRFKRFPNENKIEIWRFKKEYDIKKGRKFQGSFGYS